jgi:exodeoxyribonuclease III
MKIISWNVNSIHARLPRVTALLARYRPDVACLQEIKTTAKEFPAADFTALGYQAAVHGQAGRNGVAVLSRTELTDVARGFADDPVPEQARVLSVTAGGVRVVTFMS